METWNKQNTWTGHVDLGPSYDPHYRLSPEWPRVPIQDRMISGAELAQIEAQYRADFDVSKKALSIIKKRLAAEQKALKLPVLDAPKRVRKLKLCDHCQCALTEAA